MSRVRRLRHGLPFAPPSSNCAEVLRKSGSMAKVRSNFFTLSASKEASRVAAGLVLCLGSLPGRRTVASAAALSPSSCPGAEPSAHITHPTVSPASKCLSPILGLWQALSARIPGTALHSMQLHHSNTEKGKYGLHPSDTMKSSMGCTRSAKETAN